MQTKPIKTGREIKLQGDVFIEIFQDGSEAQWNIVRGIPMQDRATPEYHTMCAHPISVDCDVVRRNGSGKCRQSPILIRKSALKNFLTEPINPAA